MKKLYSIFLVTLLLIISNQYAYKFIAYRINQDFITSTLCINREVPDSDCHGKCHLKSQLNEENQNSTPILPNRIFDTEQILFCSLTFIQNLINQEFTKAIYVRIDDFFNIEDIIYTFFHPPQISI